MTVGGGALVNAQELRTRAIQLDGAWSTLALDFTKCAASSAANAANLNGVGEAFDTDLASWKIFFQTNEHSAWIASGAEAGLDTQQKILSDWQIKIRGLGCAISGVVIPPPPPPTPLVNVGAPAAFGLGAVLAGAGALLAVILLRR